MGDGPLADLLERLDRERAEADRRYNDALTALDRALWTPPPLPAPPDGADESRLPDVNRHWNLLPDGPPRVDRSPKGRLRGFVWRLIGPALETQQQFNAAIADHLNRNAAQARLLPRIVSALREAIGCEFEALARFQSLLVQYLQTITLYVDSRDRALAGAELRARLGLVEQRLLALKRDVERGGAGGSPEAPSQPWSPHVFGAPADSPTYLGFEDAFRGSRAAIAARVADYLPLLASATDVVDVGCGRGELLDALKDAGVAARGVDLNQAMVGVCRSRGLDVTHADALSYLERQSDASVGGLVAIQVVEHFEPAYLLRFLETAHHKMRPGAPLVLETINPACWLAFFEAYLRDLTHQRPLHPDTLKYLVEASGFVHVDVKFRRPVPEADRLARVPVPGGPDVPPGLAAVAEALNAHADALNTRLFSATDYVLVGRRQG